MPRYLHIPHTPDTAWTLTLSGRNCLVVSGMVTPSLKSATGAYTPEPTLLCNYDLDEEEIKEPE